MGVDDEFDFLSLVCNWTGHNKAGSDHVFNLLPFMGNRIGTTSVEVMNLTFAVHVHQDWSQHQWR